MTILKKQRTVSSFVFYIFFIIQTYTSHNANIRVCTLSTKGSGELIGQTGSSSQVQTRGWKVN